MNSILENFQNTKKLEYLYLIIEIIKALNKNKEINKITSKELSYFLLCIKLISEIIIIQLKIYKDIV